MFEARLAQGNAFKQIIDCFKEYDGSVATMECTENSLYLQAMDCCKVSLMAVSLNATAFEHYRCDQIKNGLPICGQTMRLGYEANGHSRYGIVRLHYSNAFCGI
mmetsp:Transcript_176/g.270  ORF Transcript_176/g.270 Transcript_176/m.270 type:complete len:104 (-) Transcript_176:26-337(-)